jgi:hypothetical protein
MTLEREWIGSPNYSSRGGSSTRLIVLHTAEGARTYQSLGSYFQGDVGASSHTGIDDTPGRIGEYVGPDWKAWTQAEANPYAVAVELCAFAAWTTDEWHAHPAMLDNCAQWINEESKRFGIPLRRLSAGEAQGGEAGVCMHVDLGSMGGGHWDCGDGFPIDEVIGMAGGIITQPDRPHRKGREMICATASGEGYWTTTSDGAVYAFGDAVFRGSSFDVDPLTPGDQKVEVTGEIVGIAGKGNDGYWLLASDGGIFTFGSAHFMGRPDRV